MNPFVDRDDDLETLRRSLHQLDDDRIDAIQKKRYWRGVSKKNDGTYSLSRLLTAMRQDSVERDAPFEWQCSEHIAKTVGRAPHNGYVFVPIEHRDITVASATQAGNLVGTDVGPGDLFVAYLDQFFPFAQLGITRLTLQRPANIPGCSANVTTTWLANEASTVAESQPTTTISASTPKTVGAYVEASGQFLKQTTAAAQNFVTQILSKAVAADMSRKLLTGSGANGQLQGIFGYTGVSTLAGGSANYSKCLDMIESLESNSALLTPGSAAFVMPSNVAKLLRGRETTSGSGLVMRGSDVSGYPGIVTQGTSPNTMVFGDFSQLALLEYGVLEIGTDPYGAASALFKVGLVGIRCLYTIDMVLLNPKSFCVTGSLN